MFNPIKRWQQKRKETAALLKIIAAMQAEEQMVVNDLVRQVEQKLSSMPPDEALRVIAKLKGEA